jgi:hypothetical protein
MGVRVLKKFTFCLQANLLIDTNCLYICPTTNFSKFILPVIKCLLSLISELEKQCDMGLNSLTNTLTILVKSSFLTEY